MKKWCVILIFLSNLSLADDKFEHFAASYGVALTLSQVTKEPVFGFIGSLALGIGKEFLIDSKPDKADVLYDFLGTSLGVGMSIIIEY